jgi:hypothetical protein
VPKARDTLLASNTRPGLVLTLKNVSLPAQLPIANDDVIIDHARSLDISITNGTTDKLKTSLFNVLTHQLACMRTNRNVGGIFTGIVQRGLPSTNCQI